MMSNRSLIVLVLALGLAATSCSRPKKVLTAQQRNEVDKNILTALPDDPGIRRLDINFEDKVILLGYSLVPERLEPGKSVTITYYWQCKDKVPGDFKIFVHMDSSKRSLFDHFPMAGLYTTDKWEPGQIIVDAQNLTVPKDYPIGPARIWVGFFDAKAWKERQENRRLALKDRGKARAVDGDRVLVTTLAIGSRDLPSARVLRAEPGMVVDGELTEAAWSKAMTQFGSFVDERTGQPLPAKQQVRAGLLWDDEFLYVGYEIQDGNVSSPYTDRDSTLWSNGKRGTMDVMELFLTPASAAGGEYLELQIAPSGAIFDARFTSHRKPDWREASKDLQMNLESAVKVDGTLNSPEPDQGYRAELKIPFKDLPGVSQAPAAGTVWKINMFRLSNGPEKPAAWSQAGGDYHDLDAGGTITFVNE